MNSLSTLFSLSKSWVKVLEIVSSFVFSLLFSCQRCSRLSSCFCELLSTVQSCSLVLFALFLQWFLSSSLIIDASFSKISFSFLNYYIWVGVWINAQYDCPLFFDLISNSSSVHYSMFSFNFNNFLFCNAIYVLDFSFNGVTQHFGYIRWYSRIVFFNFKSMYITKTGYLSFSSSLNCVKFFILLVHF